MAKVTLQQDPMNAGIGFLVQIAPDEMLGHDSPQIIIKAAHKISDKLVEIFTPEIEAEFRKQIPELVKQMGNELIVKGLKQMAKEDKK